MSLGGFYLDQFKITYNTTLFPTRLDYGIELISKYASAIVGASDRGESYWGLDSNKDTGDYTKNGISVYDLQSRVPVWGDEYPENSYTLGVFLKYDDLVKTKYLLIILTTSIMYFDAEYTNDGDTDYRFRNSFPFYKANITTSVSPFISETGGMPVSIGAMLRNTEFDLSDVLDNTKSIFEVSDTPFFSLNGCFINSFSNLDAGCNIPYVENKGSLAIPKEGDSFVFGLVVKDDVIISLFRNSNWNIGNYNVTIFGDIVDCYNKFDSKKFSVIQGSSNYYNNWSNVLGIEELEKNYNNMNYSFCPSYVYNKTVSYGARKDYLMSVISSVSYNTHFLACTGSYLYFNSDITNNACGSKYKGKINSDVYRQCNECFGSEIVLDGNFIRIGNCLVGWDYTNPNLLS